MAAHSAQEQLLNLSVVESTLFWTGLSFLVLLFVIWRYVVPVMGKALQERQEKIATDIERAEELRLQAQTTVADYEKKLAEAQKEAQTIIANARTEAEKMIASKTAELERDLARKAEEAQANIASAKTAALQEVRTEVASLALTAAEKILQDEVDAKKASKITDTLLKEMQ